MKSFIRIAEVWKPAADGKRLVLSSGLFPEVPAFEAITREMVFARGEGLPGRAWEAGHPLMLNELVGSYFKRAAAARAIDLTCAVACPLFQGHELRCVVVFLMGGAPSSVGSVELWRNDSRLPADMHLVTGYFGSSPQAAALEALTLNGWLSRGTGAPGLAWQQQEAVCIPDIATSKHFLRKDEALALGIGRALAIPLNVTASSSWVLALLSAASAPIALRVEIWRASESRPGNLSRTAGFCERLGPLPAGERQSHAVEALGPIGTAWRTGLAQADNQLAALAANTRQPALATANASGLIALPVLSDDAVTEVVALYF
ncbi:hypothetical protein LPB72_03345 [Hydrogenophaga crassostreae]|uniref:GAF domain-containing protein n=1 Tax=Hydrogenophaga crassostreae TaxID=1763535 RepID=A0A167ITX4_9BURK|nr:hypothetical protein [Hydrogenophaga crassostreae]AOW14394.1 hypothetical protein LPB072_17690 [Hydrogenophaga crassostreae]OAD43581.1 hypothetical protein LPB72_03345 [Hydrogenophaga crassostreae]